MRKTIVGLVIVLLAVVLPASISIAEPGEVVVCDRGVLIEGRCLSVDDQASLCNGAVCVEFVEASTAICPTGSDAVGGDPLSGCVLTEDAAQGDPRCPDGARGEAGDCFIYLAIGPDGCHPPTVAAEGGNCRRPVADAAGAFYCERPDAALAGTMCTSIVDSIPSPCAADTTRFDGACWRLSGLVAPETCAGHSVGTTELESGRCRVPLAVPVGPTTCVDVSQYREHPSFILISQVGEFQGEGPADTACVDDSASTGIEVVSCFFLDDDLEWSDRGDDQCTRFEPPLSLTCPVGFSIDDVSGGFCRRFEAPTDGACADATEPGSVIGAPPGLWCLIASDFAEFACPVDMAPFADWPTCAAYRTWQGQVSCGDRPALLDENEALELGLPLGCFAHLGPQPDTCNGIGTLADCYEIREPAPVSCAAESGCVSIEPGSVLTTCQGRPITVDLNLAPPQVPTAGADVILGTPGVDIIDALDGDDIICSGDGDDVVTGGAGNDVIRGGSGNDWIHGGTGDDRLFGVAGDDIINGGAGSDTLHGNRGSDTLDGGADDDRLFGYADDDILNGGDGDDKIFGHFGNDTIDGGPGNDRLFGWGDNDTIDGGDGDDLISGNFGDDTIDAGAGDDTVYGADGDDTINGGPGNDDLNGNSLRDTINGGLGDDTIDGGIGSDVCNGNFGTDTATRCEMVTSIP